MDEEEEKWMRMRFAEVLPATILKEKNELELDRFTYGPEGSRDSEPDFTFVQNRHRQRFGH